MSPWVESCLRCCYYSPGHKEATAKKKEAKYMGKGVDKT